MSSVLMVMVVLMVMMVLMSVMVITVDVPFHRRQDGCGGRWGSTTGTCTAEKWIGRVVRSIVVGVVKQRLLVGTKQRSSRQSQFLHTTVAAACCGFCFGWVGVVAAAACVVWTVSMVP